MHIQPQGVANANAAEAADATVVFYNPAGMTRLDGTQVSGVLNVVLALVIRWPDLALWLPHHVSR